ncbi:AraC family transcriptional regulator [Streptosporangium sp. NPDC051022]|uniref:AraC family transcriptional regulator n=1 Tax=Streptosporangium sp. NPDC051022 TaxID=3155752 RepID=UPI0034206908
MKFTTSAPSSPARAGASPDERATRLPGRGPRWEGSATAVPGLLAFTGAIGSAEPHAHAAVQALLVFGGEVVLRDGRGHRRRVQAAIIPAGVRHELRASPDSFGLLAYLDPTGPAGRAATARAAASGEADAVSTWQAAALPLAATAGVTAGVTGPAELSSVLCSTVPSAGTGDFPAALSRALQAVPLLVDGPLLLDDLAARAGVSASRLGHLFAEHLHLPYPAWRRWTRLLHAIQAVRGGATLTRAAHAAGFADSAHLSRTCRAMFGITPSQALAATGWNTAAHGRR